MKDGPEYFQHQDPLDRSAFRSVTVSDPADGDIHIGYVPGAYCIVQFRSGGQRHYYGIFPRLFSRRVKISHCILNSEATPDNGTTLLNDKLTLSVSAVPENSEPRLFLESIISQLEKARAPRLLMRIFGKQ